MDGLVGTGPVTRQPGGACAGSGVAGIFRRVLVLLPQAIISVICRDPADGE